MVQQQIKAYRNEVVAQIASAPTEWQAYHLKQLEQSLEQARLQVGRMMAGTWVEASSKATALALAGVHDPLSAIGIPAGQMHMIPIQEIAVINNYVPSLIVGVTDDVHKQVRNLLRRSLLGAAGPDSVMKQLGNIVGPLKPGQRPPGTVFASADVRARTILRTEMNRLHNLVKTQRVNDVSEKYPGVGYKWLHRNSPSPRAGHAALHGKVIFPADGETFSVGGVPAKGPHDPALPAEDVINCHCTAVVVYDAEKGAKAAAESPYIAGDGSGIPTAGMKTPKPKKAPSTPPGPKTFIDNPSADPITSMAHNLATKEWAKIKDPKAAQAAYDKTYKDQVLKGAIDQSLKAESAYSGTLPQG
jgi:hypothetical protein